VIAFLSLPARPIQAQVELRDARQNYQVAKIQYEASVEGHDAIRTLQLIAIDSVTAARAPGQGQRLEAALAAAQAYGTNRRNAELNLSRRRDELREAGEELLARLDRSVAELETQLRTRAGEPEIVRATNIALQQTHAEIGEVEAILREIEQPVSPIEIIPVQRDPRNSRQDYLNQAQLYEGRVRTFEDFITETEAEIRNLIARRGIEDERSSRERFPSNPVGGRTSVGGSITERDLLDARIAVAQDNLAAYIVARDACRLQAQVARAIAAERAP
jgi:hypothetical protein